MKWGLALINLCLFFAFSLMFSLMILYFKLRSSAVSFDEDVEECPFLTLSSGDQILADTQPFVVMEEYPFILNDAKLLKPCGQSGNVYEVVLDATDNNHETLISKFEPDEWDPDTQMMESGIIYDCTGYALYYADFTIEVASSKSNSSYADYQIGSVAFYQENGDSVAYLEIEDDRLSANLLANDGETVLATFKRISEKQPDFVITVKDTSNQSFDSNILFLSFGIWTFSDEVGAIDLCFIMKYGTIIGSIVFGLLFVFALFISVSFTKQTKQEKNKIEV
jgi:hypothetical protein